MPPAVACAEIGSVKVRYGGDCDRLVGPFTGAKSGGWLALRVLAVALALGVSAPARADWEYARWGMSVDEVVAASRGRATKTTPLEQGPSLVSTGYFLARAQY